MTLDDHQTVSLHAHAQGILVASALDVGFFQMVDVCKRATLTGNL